MIKVLVEIKNGQLFAVTSTSEDVEIFVADHDTEPEEFNSDVTTPFPHDIVGDEEFSKFQDELIKPFVK